MALDVIVNITQQQAAGTVGFGMPLIVSGAVTYKESGGTAEASRAVPYTVCTSLDDVIEAGFYKTSKLYAAAELMLAQENRPKQFAIYGEATSALNGTRNWAHKDWRQLIVVNAGNCKASDIAAFVESLGESKMYFTSIQVTPEGDTSLADAWKTAFAESGLAKYDRTTVMYYTDAVQTPEAALVGATAGRTVGSFTYKNIILKGVPALDLTDAQIAAINGTDETGHALTVVSKAGDIVTTEGKVASGEYIDIIDSKDWIVQNIAYDVQKILNMRPKVPYTNAGITTLENAVLSVLKTAFINGMIAPQEDNDAVGAYSTNFTRRADMSDSKISGRVYDGGKFTFTLAGAIHEAEINGTLVI